MLVYSGNGSKKILEFSIKGRVGGSGGGQCQIWPTHPPKKVKKSWSKMAYFDLKWILKACFFLFFFNGFWPSPDPPTHPPLMDKKNKKTCWFFGLFSTFGTKKFFENFSPWKFLNPHIYGQIFLIVGFLGWFFLLWTLIPQNSTQKTNNQESDLVYSGNGSKKILEFSIKGRVGGSGSEEMNFGVNKVQSKKIQPRKPTIMKICP